MDLLYFSIIVPIISLFLLMYRYLIFKYYDQESLAFGIILGFIPILNLVIGIFTIVILIHDITITPKFLKLKKQNRKKFIQSRFGGETLDYPGW